MPKKEKINTYINLSTGKYPVQVIREYRNGVRASVGTRQILLRYPHYFSQKRKAETWNWFLDWVRDLEKRRPGTLAHLQIRGYTDGQELKVGARKYRLRIREKDRKSAGGKLHPDRTIELSLPRGLPAAEQSALIRKLCSRLVGRDFLPEIEKRVHQLNAEHFGKKVETVRLKYNSSNWGSCSSKRNINLSTRLLFAPPAVIDYVIIHELAHLVHPNHSPRFWQLVARIMPDYKQHEKWLAEHGKDCDF